MALLLHYTGQDYISRGLLNTELTPGSTSAIVGGCKTGKGFAFDGTANSAFEINELTDSDKFSIDFWYYTGANISTQQSIFSDYSQVSGRLNIRVLNGTFSAFVYNTSNAFSIVSSNGIVINTWYHVAVTVDTIGNLSMYLNGVLQRQSAITGTAKSSRGLYSIGKRYTNADLLLTGTKICNFKYYNHVLSAREIAEDYKSLMLHYKLDKPITTQVFDYSGFNRHITNLTSNTVTLDSNSQVYSASLKNNGTQSLVGTSDLTDLNGLDEGSFSFRAFLTTNASDQYVIYNMNALSGGNGILFSFRNDAVAFFYGTRIQFNYTPTVGAWHHVVLVKTSTQIKVYADGVNVYTVSATTSSKNFSNITSISSTPTGEFPIRNGNIQDIRFYAKALTQEDVTELYRTRHMVDKDSNCYTYELIEGQATVGMNKQGQLLCDEIIENEDGVFQIGNNKTIKTKEIKEI